MRFLFTAIILLQSWSVASNGVPASLDYFFDFVGLPGKYLSIHDPGFIVIELDNGKRLDCKFSEIEYDTLYNWIQSMEESSEHRKLYLRYTLEGGVTVFDVKTKTEFKLTGKIEHHPIDWASETCMNQFNTHLGMMSCKSLALSAWDAELNRMYQNLGGSKNRKLKTTQNTWAKYRAAQMEFINQEYSSRNGAIWALIKLDHQINMTKDQALRLQSIKGW